MTLDLKVPDISCPDCAETITEAVTTADPQAKVDVNVEAKTVRVETKDAEETIRQAITAAGYTVA